MARTLMMLSLAFVVAWFAAGCTTATVSVRQPDGTYRTSKELIWWTPDSYRSFECQEDYMVATSMWGVTYEWPKGKGHLVNLESTSFTGDGIECQTHQRMLTLNGQEYGEFEEGDRIRITPDARVLVNGVERSPNPMQ